MTHVIQWYQHLAVAVLLGIAFALGVFIYLVVLYGITGILRKIGLFPK